jgi:hypothetical protein
MPLAQNFLVKPLCQQVEIILSQITRLSPQHIHFVTWQGLKLRSFFILLAPNSAIKSMPLNAVSVGAR